MIKLSDYISKRLKEVYLVKDFFMVSGGGSMHLNDSLGKSISYIANHHEQASAIAAEGYARINQNSAVVNVTTGPGGINCLNGVFGQWTDSVPVLYISGQVKYSTTVESCSSIPLRQLGDQEVDIITLVTPLTKYAKMVTEPNEIKYHLDKAIYEATTGRFGPVWLDIPMDVQSSMIDESELLGFTPPENPKYDLKIDEVIEKLKNAKRPLIIAGHGIRLSKQENTLYDLLEKLEIPVVTTFNGFDVLESDNKHYVGRIGTVGQRNGNFALQNADLILCLGTRNNIRQISYNYENFAKKSFKIVVDIDKAELDKPTIIPDIRIQADLKEFLPALAKNTPVIKRTEWLKWCKEKQEKYSFENTKEYKQETDQINVYHFTRVLTNLLDENSVLVASNGSACVCLHQVGIVKKGQRIFWNSGDASMGYDLPASIGASVLNKNKDVVCLAGDGSIMMNIQELQTIKHNNLPIKIFVLNNSGYASIKQTQKNFFDGRMTGAGNDSGVSVPDFCSLAQGFGLISIRIADPTDLEGQIKKVLDSKGPILCEVITEGDYSFVPKLASRTLDDGSMVSSSLEDMFPFLDRNELKNNMIED